jgi:hypothetical protein
MKLLVKNLLARLGYELHSKEYLELVAKRDARFPAGHFYSPYPDLADIIAQQARIFSRDRIVADVDLNEEPQLTLLKSLAGLYSTLPFTPAKSAGTRYWYDNPHYPYSDGIVLNGMLRLLQPRLLIEVGSGYSSAMTLDTNELFLQNQLEVILIEPYPELVLSLMKPGDRKRTSLIPSRLQDLDATIFDRLQANDVLFIDSTHVSKVDSDVNFIFFEILPRLKTGVVVHFHDVFYPFEYPKEWVLEGRAWQEQYLLRVLLQHPSAYRTLYFQDMMFHRHREFFREHMPLCLESGGANLWLQKVH